MEPSVGALLHAYEVGTLSEKDIELFEIHLLKCDRCFSEMNQFAPHAELLCSDKGVRHEAAHAVSPAGSVRTFAGRVRRSLLPDIPWIYRPALLLTLVILLLYPAYLGVRTFKPAAVTSVQTISLYPARSAAVKPFRIAPSQDVVLSFVFEGALVGKQYEIEIRRASGSVLFSDSSFDTFDEWGTGHLLLPAGLLRSGRYLLIMTDLTGPPDANVQEYRFTISAL
jgi:hypothetical protein